MTSVEVLKELQAAGLDGLPGGGGEMLVDDIRHAKHISPARISSDDWIRVMGEAQDLGLYNDCDDGYRFWRDARAARPKYAPGA